MSKFMFGLQTLHDLGDEDVARQLWSLLDVPHVEPVGFGSTEDVPEPFRGGAETAARTYGDYRLVLVRGEKSGFQAMFQRQHTGWHDWTFWINTGAVSRATDRWLEWLFEIVRAFPVLYGYGCTEDELDAKHADVEELDEGGLAEGAVGLSADELRQHLPGVYWLTIFGRELVAHFGADHIAAAPGATATPIDGQVALHLDEPPVAEDMEERMLRERAVAQHLGAEYFFERSRDPSSYKVVPAFVERLDAAAP